MELPSAASVSEEHRSTSTVETVHGHSASTAVAAAKHGPFLRDDFELSNLHTLATLIARSALAREESRGSHYRSDFPYRDDDVFQKHSLIQRSKDVTWER
jgi:succinate dehydrogenase/fumarate reductase flavoprotein subunit